ncbi:MAG: hypothetical protein K8F91_17405, partial [Candidatus Obscuribacterales bacterium]|nr:hypothetical protein [Candidatus Obscuribacterales bacterium]
MNFKIEDDVNIEDYVKAGRLTTPPEELEKLSRSNSVKIRCCVAENRASPKYLLERLSKDPNPEVKMELAINESTPVRLKWKLAIDDDIDLRYRVAETPYIPFEILLGLSHDENPYVADRAMRTLEAILENNTIVKIERTVRRMLHNKPHLNKNDARKVRTLVLEDGYLSRSERKILMDTIKNAQVD